MKLRLAKYEDWKTLLEWRNDPITRLNSFNQDILEEKKHIEWFSKSLKLKERKIFIMEDENKIPIGTIRADEIEQGVYILSWNIAQEQRGYGYGKMLLELFFKNNKGKFIAEIKPQNIPSVKIAESNGFIKINDITYVKNL